MLDLIRNNWVTLRPFLFGFLICFSMFSFIIGSMASYSSKLETKFCEVISQEDMLRAEINKPEEGQHEKRSSKTIEKQGSRTRNIKLGSGMAEGQGVPDDQK
jgi:hypothetical protein